jgi:hypothetical protein
LWTRRGRFAAKIKVQRHPALRLECAELEAGLLLQWPFSGLAGGIRASNEVMRARFYESSAEWEANGELFPALVMSMTQR